MTGASNTYERLSILVLLCAGAILGWGVWLGLIHQAADQPPPGWERENSPVPYRESALQGASLPKYGQWGLDFYRAIYPSSPSTEGLSLTATIPTEGMLEVWYSSPPLRKRMGDRWMDICTMRAPRGMQQDPRCLGKSDLGVALVLSRLSGQQFVSVIAENAAGRKTVPCSTPLEDISVIEGAIEISLLASTNELTIRLNDQSIQCTTTVGDRLPMLRSGLRQVHIESLTYGATQASTIPRYWQAILVGGGVAFLLALGWVERRHGARSSSLVWTTAPMLLGLWFQQWDAKVLIEDLRAAWLSPYWVATYCTLFPSLMLKCIAATWRSTNRDDFSARWVGTAMLILGLGNLFAYDSGWIGSIACAGVQIAAILVCRWWKVLPAVHGPVVWGTLGGTVLIAVDAFHWAGSLWGTIGGVSFGLLLLANRFVVPHFNSWSLGLLSLLLVSGEVSLRATKAGLQWSNKGANTEHNEIFGWVRQANESFELFEEGKHTQYPDKGYPVSIQAQNHKQRIVSFGGSTTGGAFQNDNLDEFYPALIERVLRNPKQPFEVLNQGVGGWTTWHIEAYIKQKSTVLNPDIITLYVGHNDILTSVPMPYKELYPLWQKQKGSAVSQTLSSLRLYQALKYSLVSLKGAQNKVAVPVEDARNNILSIVETFPNTPIILGSEGLSPEPGILFPYNTMLKDLAEQYPTVHYIPTAEALSKEPPHEVFLDDCHLTTYGHQIVAELFANKIQEITAQ